MVSLSLELLASTAHNLHLCGRPRDHEHALHVVGAQVTILASSDATQSYGITLQQGKEGTGPPLHSHD